MEFMLKVASSWQEWVVQGFFFGIGIAGSGFATRFMGAILSRPAKG